MTLEIEAVRKATRPDEYAVVISPVEALAVHVHVAHHNIAGNVRRTLPGDDSAIVKANVLAIDNGRFLARAAHVPDACDLRDTPHSAGICLLAFVESKEIHMTQIDGLRTPSN